MPASSIKLEGGSLHGMIWLNWIRLSGAMMPTVATLTWL
ncbi:hypothetical protein X742_35195 [Mesorhizobium sp. LNHC232B00]|nr:hypothetical protein X742_35195 [Mesorhizobium sp. LNHC232B00]